MARTEDRAHGQDGRKEGENRERSEREKEEEEGEQEKPGMGTCTGISVGKSFGSYSDRGGEPPAGSLCRNESCELWPCFRILRSGHHQLAHSVSGGISFQGKKLFQKIFKNIRI